MKPNYSTELSEIFFPGAADLGFRSRPRKKISLVFGENCFGWIHLLSAGNDRYFDFELVEDFRWKVDTNSMSR